MNVSATCYVLHTLVTSCSRMKTSILVCPQIRFSSKHQSLPKPASILGLIGVPLWMARRSDDWPSRTSLFTSFDERHSSLSSYSTTLRYVIYLLMALLILFTMALSRNSSFTCKCSRSQLYAFTLPLFLIPQRVSNILTFVLPIPIYFWGYPSA